MTRKAFENMAREKDMAYRLALIPADLIPRIEGMVGDQLADVSGYIGGYMDCLIDRHIPSGKTKNIAIVYNESYYTTTEMYVLEG
jgi:hypothetical protein